VSYNIDEKLPNSGVDYKYRIEGQEDSELNEEYWWNRNIALYCFLYGGPAHQIFEDSTWPDHIMFDFAMARFFWDEIYVPTIRGSK
jgi:hypothetical protein